MYIKNFINHHIPNLSLGMTITEALVIMNDFHVTELPLIKEGKVIALIKESDLFDIQNKQQPIATLHWEKAHPILAHANIYDTSLILAEQKLSLLPVVDNQENYIGVVTKSDLFDYYIEHSGISYPGGIIVLTMKSIDYSLSEIIRICDNNETIVLNTQIVSSRNDEWLDIILKTNKKDLQALKAAFERFGYNIKNIFGNLPAQEDLNNRYRLLMNYINM